MYVAKICLNSAQGGPISYVLGRWYYDDSPTSVAQDGCHLNTGWI